MLHPRSWGMFRYSDDYSSVPTTIITSRCPPPDLACSTYCVCAEEGPRCIQCTVAVTQRGNVSPQGLSPSTATSYSSNTDCRSHVVQGCSLPTSLKFKKRCKKREGHYIELKDIVVGCAAVLFHIASYSSHGVRSRCFGSRRCETSGAPELH
jgi:hypothetical protein